MAILPIPGEPSSGVKFARASEVQFIEAKRKPLQNEGQGPLYYRLRFRHIGYVVE